MVFMEGIYKDLISIMSDIVIKREDLALEGESLESRREFEIYLASVNGTATFLTFPSYEFSILRKYLPSSILSECVEDHNKIPEEYRPAIIRDMMERWINNYVEKNEYFRMLQGLPPLGSTQFFYITDQSDIDPETPLHELSNETITKLTMRGILQNIQKNHPDAKYLHHLGIHKISIIKARLARPFDILYLGTSSSNATLEAFQREYYNARRYVLANFHNRGAIVTRELYDPFIALLILGIAARNCMVMDEKDYFSNEEMLNHMLESYGILEIFEKFPFTYKQRLVLMLDQLLAEKGTDGVLLDVCSIFSPEGELSANRYYILKARNHDEFGDPMATGNLRDDWNLTFIPAAISAHDIDNTVRIPYDEMTGDDPYWDMREAIIKSEMVDDGTGTAIHRYFIDETGRYRDRATIPPGGTDADAEEVLKAEATESGIPLAVYQEDFNLLMSKYIGIEAAYDTTYTVFELSCFLNLLLSAREYEQHMTLPNIYATDGACELFTMLLFLLSCMAKYSGFDGNVVFEPEAVSQVWRFRYGDSPTLVVCPKDSESPYDLGWLEEIETLGTSASSYPISGVTYYRKSALYGDIGDDELRELFENGEEVIILEKVENPNNADNPSELGWLEKQSQFIRSNDTIPDSTKAYYTDFQTALDRIVKGYEDRPDVGHTILSNGMTADLDRSHELNSIQGLINTYIYNRDLYQMIEEDMRTTESYDHYVALSHLKNILFVSAVEEATFLKTDGSVARTYLELLKEFDIRLYNKVVSLEGESLRRVIVYTLEQLDSFFHSGDLKYLFLSTPEVYGDLIGGYMETAINFFKAAMVELKSIGVYFKLGDHDPFKIIEQIHQEHEYAKDEYIHIVEDIIGDSEIIINELICIGDRVHSYTNHGREWWHA